MNCGGNDMTITGRQSMEFLTAAGSSATASSLVPSTSGTPLDAPSPTPAGIPFWVWIVVLLLFLFAKNPPKL
jgi:hypothetical protein